MPQYDVIMFDLGGVLVELTGIPHFVEWTNDTRSPEELWQMWLHSPSVRQFETGKTSTSEFASSMIAEFDFDVEPHIFLKAFELFAIQLYPGVLQLLSDLRSSYRLACLSNTNDIHWRKLDEHIDLISHFDICFASHQTGLLKPDPQAFAHAIQQLNCPPQSIVYFDDIQTNIDAAKHAGLTAMQTDNMTGVIQNLHQLNIHP